MKYHVEARIGTSPSFKIREKDTYTSKGKPHKIGLDYFAKEKFDHTSVKNKISEILGTNSYRKVLVVWNVKDMSLLDIAPKKYGFEIWFIDDLINELLVKGNLKGSRDDVLRVIELISILQREAVRISRLGGRVTKKEIEEESRLPQIPREERTKDVLE